MTSINTMPPVEKLINFACSIGIADSNGVSLVNRFVVKPINWMVADDSTHKVSRFIWKEIIARIWAVTTPVFAGLTALYHLGAVIVKTPLAGLKAAGIKQIPDSCGFRAIRDNLLNMAQAVVLTAIGIAAVVRPDKLAEYAYPLSDRSKVPIFGYHEVSHHIGDAWTVSPETFRSHLQHLCDKNYELCTLEELSEGYIASPGKKLAVITFDDSHESQFRIKDSAITSDCAIGVMEKFKEENPNFKCTATFFINTSPEPGATGTKKHQIFENNPDQADLAKEKLQFLSENGYEVAAHGHEHLSFDKLTKEQIEEDLDKFEEAIANAGFSPKKITSFAWPYGRSPSGEEREVITKRFKNVADFGRHAGKEAPERMDRQRVRRLFIGPNTGFKQYAT